jgi:hypothetical protein
MRKLIKKILKESDFGWTQSADVTWSTYYNEILNDMRALPKNLDEITEEMLSPIWIKFSVLHREARKGIEGKEVGVDDDSAPNFRRPHPLLHSDTYFIPDQEIMDTIEMDMRDLMMLVGGSLDIKNSRHIFRNEPDPQRVYERLKKFIIGDITELISHLRHINENFDWTKQVGITPNYQGHPQGVVHLRSHDEIDEFFDLIGSSYGIVGKRKNELEVTKRDFHNALEETRDRFEGPDWGGHSNWIPTISASFFISKKDPTKYDTGYWDFDVEEDSVEDWLTNEGCEHEVVDCEN